MPNIFWQFLAYIILTSAEILVSIVCLEFAYTQSPPKMKSLIMGVYFLGVSLGNFYVAGVNALMERFKSEDGSTFLDGATYYWFFAGVMGATFLIYLIWAKTYKGQTYIQGDTDAATEAEAEAIAPDAH
jgi:POT family proton-dependent oligopeptide transporter